MLSSITTSQQGKMLAHEEPHHDASSAPTRSTLGTFTACFLVPYPRVPSQHGTREQTREGKWSGGECRGAVRRASQGQGGNCANTVSWHLGESLTQPKLVLQVAEAYTVICPFPEEISQPVLPPLENLQREKARGKPGEKWDELAGLWGTHSPGSALPFHSAFQEGKLQCPAGDC